MSAQGQPIIILREGTERSRGSDARNANIMAARAVADAIKTSLGPKGMDKMLVDTFGDVTITSDGATMLKEMEIQHPAAKMMVEVAETQDDEVGDGTTSVVVFAGELLGKAVDLMGKKVHPTVIIDGYRNAQEQALRYLDEVAIRVDPRDKEMLKKVAATSMASKLLAGQSGRIAELAVDAVLQVAEEADGGLDADLEMVKLEKKPGGSLTDTGLIRGLVIDKEVAHADMSRLVREARIGLLNAAMEVEKTEFDSKIHIESPEEMQAYLDQEEGMLREMVRKVKDIGINVLLCQKGIDDMVQHFLAREGILAARRLKKSDMEALAKATGGKVVTSVDELTEADAGYAARVEERKIGDEKMIFVEGCRNPKAVSILIRGGTERIVDEAERSLHDALCVVRDVVRDPRVLAGGGAPEVEVARRLRRHAESLAGRERLAVSAFAEALEAIPTTLAENSGMDPIDALSEMQSRHEKGEAWAGIDGFAGRVTDMTAQDVYEPLQVKAQAIKSATEAATMLLKIDDVIAASKMKTPPMPPGGGMPGGMPPM
ncbi:thermosome subunit [miscellaneous Crenarchaeota group-15 archaeon DG-45]|uniref:T-complex protein 1 subunit alpha n=1 Tax=miscellaneous Crenarchaeota group-15 archaeon DG-45 TaxID=1685127 RepID=A0A0M0BSD0_9ARCH|nr:MAG: thermosome subunit [miscellaneous Crenarchaeota group-15 archaeon DG-45]